MRCLVVEDAQRLQRYVAKGLRQAGYAVDTVSDGSEALSLLHHSDYDVVILDLMLPKIDGMSILQRMKEDGVEAGVLILSARDTVDDRVRGLEAGADDYLVKPFALEELLARVQALVRRKYRIQAPNIPIRDLNLDLNLREVSRSGQILPLKPREYAVLEYLALHKEKVVSSRELMYHIYDFANQPSSNAIESAISALRKVLHVEGQPSMIETRRGQGYILRDPSL